MTPQQPFFFFLENCDLDNYLTFTLTDDLFFGTKGRVLPPKNIYVKYEHSYHLPFKSYGKWKSFSRQTTEKWADRQTNGQAKAICLCSIDAGA